ncbi:MAG: Rieske (2Fe-2S) protein [Gammaproteobacteria bacterium]|jgi:nitrite reductase/ring-hydroxylating ferredoxin subunit|nr:Rieske (2Fe-2S) protein [Gammaproteobacteria bacterium]
MEKVLCQISSILEGSSYSFEIDQIALFAINKHDQIFVYLNLCPHLHAPLNWEPDKFLNNSCDLIQCSNHGALFDIENGECIQGPCKGQSLQAVDYEVKDGNIYIKESDLKRL